MNNKILLITLFLTSTLFGHSHKILDQHLESYVKNYIDHLFDPNHKNASLNSLPREVVKSVKESGNYSFNFVHLDWQYTSDDVEGMIRSGIFNLVERLSFDHAYECTANPKVAEKASQEVANETIAIFMQSGEVKQGSLSAYIGAALKKKVERVAKHIAAYEGHYTPAPKPQPQPVFVTWPSPECCVCYENFNARARVFLKPCGHDMCVICSKQWFIKDKNKTCPKCRANINVTKLEEDILEAVYHHAMYAPSAPAA